MPYIKKERRPDIDNGLPPETPGELNYKLYTVMLEYLTHKGESYATYNDIMGAHAGCMQEFYRRHIAPYEDKAIKRNGDIEP